MSSERSVALATHAHVNEDLRSGSGFLEGHENYMDTLKRNTLHQRTGTYIQGLDAEIVTRILWSPFRTSFMTC